MIVDFRRTDSDTRFTADVCIVGSGAAGLTLAAQLDGICRVLIVEAGDHEPPQGRDDWLIGESEELAFTGFEAGRRRSFGGATKGWFGQCLRLDPIDFEKRDWVANSGWPLARADLDPFYDRAEKILEIGQPTYDSRLLQSAGRPMAPFTNTEVTPRCTVYCREPDFTKTLGRQVVRKRSTVTILLNAFATDIALAENGRYVNELTIQSENGRKSGVRASAFVLCCGAIENPRLLLASNRIQTSGIGNERDLVGRFFQDHPSGTTGIINISAPGRVQQLQDQFRKFRSNGLLIWPKLALTDTAQRQSRYLNANALLLYDYDDRSALTTAKRALALAQARRVAALLGHMPALLRCTPELAVRGAHSLATGLAPIFTPSRVMLKAHVEQLPDRDNRIQLGKERDRFGVPRARLSWRVHPDELRTLRGVTEAVGRELQSLGFGKLHVADWLEQGGSAAQSQLEDTYHHAGTTRMAVTPAQGVVDTQCRVFGVGNLYVAGGSVFPTSGYANPTLTIIALAIRLADLLKTQIGQRGTDCAVKVAEVGSNARSRQPSQYADA